MGRTAENMKVHQKAERKIKELAFQNDEDKKNQVAMRALLVSCSPRSRPTRSRLRRLRRSPLSTWLSSGRLSRSLRRLRTAQGCPSLPSCSELQVIEHCRQDQGFELNDCFCLVLGHLGHYFASSSLSPFPPLA